MTKWYLIKYTASSGKIEVINADPSTVDAEYVWSGSNLYKIGRDVFTNQVEAAKYFCEKIAPKKRASAMNTVDKIDKITNRLMTLYEKGAA